MKRKIVQTGGSLAVTLPADVVEILDLKKGQEVDVTLHPTKAIITIRGGVKYFDDGKVTKRFRALTDDLLKRRAALYKELAK